MGMQRALPLSYLEHLQRGIRVHRARDSLQNTIDRQVAAAVGAIGSSSRMVAAASAKVIEWGRKGVKKECPLAEAGVRKRESSGP